MKHIASSVRVINYTVEPINADGFCFDLPLQQAVLILKTEMDLVTTAHDMHNIEEDQQRHNSQSIILPSTNEYHSELQFHILKLLKNEKDGDAEDGLHARNSGILRIISVLASVELNRNITTYSTLKRKRVDAHIGDIPITLVEEKSDRCDLEVAKRELREKFAWPPHYCNLPFIIAIAVADDVISFNKLNRSLFLMDELKVDLSLNKQETFRYSFK